MAERIDAYAHALPEEFLHEMLDRHPDAGMEALTDATHLWDIERRIADLDEFGVDRQVVMLARTTTWIGMDPEEALPLVRVANDEMAALAAESDRLVPAATIPFPGEAYVEEFERAVTDLGMVGAQILSNVDGRSIDGEEFHPLYAAAERLDAPLWIHPQLHDWYPWTAEYGNDKIFGWLFDTSLALSRLVFGGVLQTYPDLTIIPHHGGAMIPFFPDRIESFVEAYSLQEETDLDEPVIEHFRRFFPDTAFNGSVAPLEAAVDFFGADHMLFGTDYPFGPDRGRRWLRDTVRSVEAADLTGAQRDRIFGGNVVELLGL